LLLCCAVLCCACRYAAMSQEMSHTQGIRSELATEVVEARQHWVAENTYNALLQVRL
jgi:hypothetical protein